MCKAILQGQKIVTLEAYGFSPMFCKMIWNCISSASFSVLVEGSPTPPFKSQRGIRQGDPLSPILFDMIMDVLGRLIQREVKNKIIYTYQVNGATFISHLMYANDIFIFSKTNPKSLNAIKAMFEKFSLFSGLEVNASKSSSTFSKVRAEDQSLHDILGYIVKNLSITHLGLPITGKKKSFGVWTVLESEN